MDRLCTSSWNDEPAVHGLISSPEWRIPKKPFLELLALPYPSCWLVIVWFLTASSYFQPKAAISFCFLVLFLYFLFCSLMEQLSPSSSFAGIPLSLHCTICLVTANKLCGRVFLFLFGKVSQKSRNWFRDVSQLIEELLLTHLSAVLQKFLLLIVHYSLQVQVCWEKFPLTLENKSLFFLVSWCLPGVTVEMVR